MTYKNMVEEELKDYPDFPFNTYIREFKSWSEFIEEITKPSIGYGKGFEYGSTILVACKKVNGNTIFMHYHKGIRIRNIRIHPKWSEIEIFSFLNSEIAKYSDEWDENRTISQMFCSLRLKLRRESIKPKYLSRIISLLQIAEELVEERK